VAFDTADSRETGAGCRLIRTRLEFTFNTDLFPTILSLNTRYLHAYIYLFSIDYTQLLNVESKKKSAGIIRYVQDFGYL
jgi:hypothetical protein